MDQDVTWYGARPRPRRLTQSCLGRGRMGTPLPSTKGGLPKFSAHVYCDQTAGWMKLVISVEVGLSRGDFVLDGDPVPFSKRRRGPQFSAHFYCGQTAGCIKMALGMEIGLGPVHIVLDGDTAPLPKRGQSHPPNFRPIFIVAKRLDASTCHLARR